MGWFSSDDESTKTTDNTGNENVNNVVIQSPVELGHKDLIVCIYILTIITVLKFIYLLYTVHKKNLKKKYAKDVTDIISVTI